MANQEHLEILRKGVDEWNRWREGSAGIRPDLSGADLKNVDLKNADHSDADLRHADLRRADVSRANLRRADLTYAYLKDADLRNVTLEGAVLKNADLSGANLTHADLRGADLSGANLVGANLLRADLWRANVGADLRGADLTAANLYETNFSGADLSSADFTAAGLGETNFSGAVLSCANFTEALFGATNIIEVDLSDVIGLETAEHSRSSAIGIDTIFESKGKIPESFLRGCGVPDNLIDYIPSLVGEGIEFYSCFISYSTADEDFCKRLHSRMQAEHLRVWFAPEDIKGGKTIIEQLETHIRVFDKLLLVLSPTSIISDWVKTEIRKALKAEKDSGKRKLFPIRLCDFDLLKEWEFYDGGTDLAAKIREYFIPDFSNWKDHDAFEAAFARLLKDLRTEAPTPNKG